MLDVGGNGGFEGGDRGGEAVLQFGDDGFDERFGVGGFTGMAACRPRLFRFYRPRCVRSKANSVASG